MLYHYHHQLLLPSFSCSSICKCDSKSRALSLPLLIQTCSSHSKSSDISVIINIMTTTLPVNLSEQAMPLCLIWKKVLQHRHKTRNRTTKSQFCNLNCEKKMKSVFCFLFYKTHQKPHKNRTSQSLVSHVFHVLAFVLLCQFKSTAFVYQSDRKVLLIDKDQSHPTVSMFFHYHYRLFLLLFLFLL